MLYGNKNIVIQTVSMTEDPDKNYLEREVEYARTAPFKASVKQVSASYTRAVLGKFSDNFYRIRFNKNITVQTGTLIIDEDDIEYKVISVQKFSNMHNIMAEAG